MSFGFTTATHKGSSLEPALGDAWQVKLPHQCDSWMVTEGDYTTYVPHAEAVQALARFILEAEAAMAALIDRREVGDSW